MGLTNVKSPSDLLMNFHPNSRETYNPCGGLYSWTFDKSSEFEFQSYARYWHGHAEIIRWLVFFLGLPIARSFLWLIMFYFLFQLGSQLTRDINAQQVRSGIWGLFAVGIYAFFAGLPDLHTSMTHLLSEISIIIIALISYKLLQHQSKSHLILSGFAMGGAYVCTSYMINPQSIPPAILVWASIPLILRTGSVIPLLKKTILLISSFIFGFVTLWISKWVLIDQTTSYDIWKEVRSQALHRSSHSVTSLSDGVARHLSQFDSFPASIQAILANLAALVSKVYDPRYSSPILLSVYAILCFGIFLFHMKIKKIQKGSLGSDLNISHSLVIASVFTWILSLVSVFVWYIFLTQHSFDHATYTYRSLAIVLSGLPLIIGATFENRAIGTRNVPL